LDKGLSAMVVFETTGTATGTSSGTGTGMVSAPTPTATCLGFLTNRAPIHRPTRANQLAIEPMLAGTDSITGIMISVRMVEKPSPEMIAVDSCTHHTAVIDPKVTTRSMKFTLIISAIGIRPMMVVTVVSMIGRRRWAEVFSTAWRISTPSERMRL